MEPRLIAFATALSALLLIRLLMAAARRRGDGFLQPADPASFWRSYQLFFASFLTLFAELAFIRWVAVEVHIFAYFKNLALLLCFVGFGLGCTLAAQPIRWARSVTALMGLLLIVRLPSHSGKALDGISQALGSGPEILMWAAATVRNWIDFISILVLAVLLFLLLVWIFIPLGQIVGRQMNLGPGPLTSYSWNLAGSLAGILTFVAVGRMMVPPWVWMGAVLAGFALLQSKRKDRVLLAVLLIPLVLLLHDPASPNHFSIWTPYHEIEYTRIFARNGDFAVGTLEVNHTGYQSIVNLSASFLGRHPTLLEEPAEENPYNVPFRFPRSAPRVLIVGSGTGDDVAAALRHGSSAIDAVEIDPAILALGKREHPEHPYDSSRVSVHLTDARAFLKRTSKRYDLVLFALLDSHTQLSDYSNMRIDNFVYTMESLREAREHLQPDGVLVVKFVVGRPWIGERFNEMFRQIFRKEPLIFLADSSFTYPAMCFVASPSNRVEEALNSDRSLSDFVTRNRVTPGDSAVPVTTDDWPYLYQRDRSIPQAYLSIGVLVLLITLGLYSTIPGARREVPSLFYFMMGAGFMLLETQAISRLALYFGTTWQVNGIVISAMLGALLIANWSAEHIPRALSRIWIVLPLLAGLVIAYIVPFSRVPGPPGVVGIVVAVVFSVPVIFAGLLFSLEFRDELVPGAALGSNVLGAVVGGLLENLSLRFGMRALLPITIGIYCLAAAALYVRWRAARYTWAAGRPTAAVHTYSLPED
jgi:SAM-dependent methyltransferase